MASGLRSQVAVLFCSLFLLLLRRSPQCNAGILKTCRFDAIYQLGDSTSDTGNLIREDPFSPCATLPYGETLFKNATGRCSNGLLIIDFLALSAGIPFLQPYLNSEALFTRGRGVNFAVAGSTALPVEILAEKGVVAPVTNSSLSRQLDWMFTHFSGICRDDEDCSEKLKTALFIVGEIGGNDYSYALFQGKSFDEVRSMAPSVVQAIKDAVTRVVGYGATRVIIPGSFPIGCLPIYLTRFRSNASDAYDNFHCLKDLNGLSIHHNDHLKQAIKEMRKEVPHVIIVYADYYNAYMKLLNRATFLGFDPDSTDKACCGCNLELNKMCGAADVALCPNPDRYISWDGIHLTQKAYKFITGWFLHHIYPHLRCSV
ncbi:acetylajmalan esterase-like [Hibiscus syriacus]|uniref:acetylajmalan esterase-like n=1 Tax=Hibiscus syriacus TaxID=106335 RepID=UPI0019217A4E|nr:acetylajmalan esterase-like [Hibiscus syriacus]